MAAVHPGRKPEPVTVTSVSGEPVAMVVGGSDCSTGGVVCTTSVTVTSTAGEWSAGVSRTVPVCVPTARFPMATDTVTGPGAGALAGVAVSHAVPSAVDTVVVNPTGATPAAACTVTVCVAGGVAPVIPVKRNCDGEAESDETIGATASGAIFNRNI